MITITSLPYSGSAADTYILASDLAVSISTGAAITLPSNSVLDGQGYKITNTYGPSTGAYGVHVPNRNDVTVKNVKAEGFLYTVYFEGISGLRHKLLNCDLKGYFRGARVEGQQWRVGNCYIHDCGGTTFPNYHFVFGIELYGPGVIHDCQVLNTYTSSEAYEAVSVSVSEYSTVVGASNLELWNATKRLKSIGMWVGGAAPIPVVLANDIRISNMEHGIYGTAHVVRKDVHCHNVTTPWNLESSHDVDSGGNYPFGITPTAPPPPPPPPPPEELVNQIPAMTAETTAGVTIISIAGSNIYPGWSVAQTDSWCQWNGTSGAVSIEFPSAIVAKKYSMKTRVEASSQDHAPKSWTFDGWNGSSWVNLNTQTGVSAWGQAEVRTFNLTNITGYSKYRVNVTASQSGAYLQYGQLKVFA